MSGEPVEVAFGQADPAACGRGCCDALARRLCQLGRSCRVPDGSEGGYRVRESGTD